MANVMETDLDILNQARNQASHSPMVAWTMLASWVDATRFTGTTARGSVWCGARYQEVKTGVLFAGEFESARICVAEISR